MWTGALLDHQTPLLQWSAVIGASLLAAVSDLRSRRIPNLLTGPVLLAGLAWAAWIGGLSAFADSAAGMLLLAFPFVLLYAFAGGGAGDAKLMGALGSWLGLSLGAIVLVVVLLSGAALGVGSALWKQRLRGVLANLAGMASVVVLLVLGTSSEEIRSRSRTEDMETIPYGVAIFSGVCIACGGTLLWLG